MVSLTEGQARRFMVDGKRPHPQTSSGSSSSLPLPPTHEEVDLVDNFTLDPIVYVDQLPPISGGTSEELKQKIDMSVPSATLGGSIVPMDKFKFFLDTKEFKLSVADFIRIFQMPQATDNNNDGFVVAPIFSQMLPFFLDDLGFSLLIHLPSHFEEQGRRMNGDSKINAGRGNEADSSLSDIEKLVKRDENVDTYEFMDKILNTQKDPDTRLEFGSQKESPKKGIEEIRDTPIPTPIRSPGTYIAPLSSDKETIQELMASTQDAPSSSDKEKLKELMASDYIK
ncbi:hypothetical protein Tco_1540053 [Tanacetum coccineum]